MGITSVVCPSSVGKPVHPHTRGDHTVTLTLFPSLTGSPPHAWGSRHLFFLPFCSSRFTPTRVGITYIFLAAFPPKSVHPHTRGDHITGGQVTDEHYGSPPHAWGSLELVTQAERQLRFTPTRVGITEALSKHQDLQAVHPHTRGDHKGFSADQTLVTGSPPHAWGSQYVEAPDFEILRFTPTRVGITLSVSDSSTVSSVHPHTRGDHEDHLNHALAHIGSPPHAWGSLTGPTRDILTDRFTPTRVGITQGLG